MLQPKQLFLWMLLLALGGTAAFAQCRLAQFRIGPALARSESELIMNIDISYQDFAPASLICLATNLKKQKRWGRSTIMVEYFQFPQCGL